MASTAQRLDSTEATPTPLLDLPIHEPQVPERERRVGPRVSSTFIVRPLDGTDSFDGVDISFGGLMCAGGEPVWPGNVLDIDLILPGERQPVPARARVVEIVAYRGRIAMRMRFEGMNAERRKRVAGWMARRAGV
jgi:hypothetical protein